MSLDKIPKVFLDANIVIQDGKPPGGLSLLHVKYLVEVGFINILTTDLTITEVAKKHAENDYKIIKEVGRPHFRNLVKEILGSKLPDTTKTELKSKLTAIYNDSTKKMFVKLKAKTLEIDSVKPTTVLSNYATGEGFFTGDSKKDQFPDAFIFECLKAEASDEEPIIIVSEDGDFVKPVEGQEHILLVKSLPDLFTMLMLQVDTLDLEDFLENQEDVLIEAVNTELDNWGLNGDVEDSEIYKTDVTKLEINEITSFRPTKKGKLILAIGQFAAIADISYSHPNWDTAMYDSEDKCLIPFENVNGESEVSFDVDVTMLIAIDKDGNPEKIEILRFRNSDFQYVKIYPDETYK